MQRHVRVIRKGAGKLYVYEMNNNCNQQLSFIILYDEIKIMKNQGDV